MSLSTTKTQGNATQESNLAFGLSTKYWLCNTKREVLKKSEYKKIYKGQ